MGSDRVEWAIVGVRVDPPRTGDGGGGQTRSELAAQQAEQAKHDVAVGACIGHDLRWLQVGLLFEHDGQQDQALAQRTRNRDVIQIGELVRQQVVPGYAATNAEVFGV